jgi:Mg-chelatase subunit ChlD
VREVGEQLAGLFASGGTAMNDAICEAADLLRGQRLMDAALGERRLYGIVLLSDGADSASVISSQKMLATCLGGQEELGQTIRVFVIAFGEDVDSAVLKALAGATGGAVLSADPQSLQATYLKLSAEQ